MSDGRVGCAETGSRASTGPVSRPGPSGFDPARINFAGIQDVIDRQLEDAEPILRKWHISWKQHGNGYRLIGFVVRDEDAIRWSKSLFALFELAKSAPLFFRELKSAASAIEARRAETQSGSVHESAIGNAETPKTEAP